jgi:AcrR family transcriptional regulator
MKNQRTQTKKLVTRGRPRAFDYSSAVDQGMRLFWEKGYSAVGIKELTKTLGMSTSSFYATFQSKELFFAQTVEWYAEHYAATRPDIFNAAPSTVQAIALLFEESIENFTANDRPTGCYVVLGDINCLYEDELARSMLMQKRLAAVELIRCRIEQGVREKELPAELDVTAVTTIIATCVQGLSVQARDGATKKQMQVVAKYCTDLLKLST